MNILSHLQLFKPQRIRKYPRKANLPVIIKKKERD